MYICIYVCIYIYMCVCIGVFVLVIINLLKIFWGEVSKGQVLGNLLLGFLVFVAHSFLSQNLKIMI